MKNFTIPRPRRVRSYAEKFNADAEFFGSTEKAIPVGPGSLPILLGLLLGVVVLIVGVMLGTGFWTIKEVEAADGQLYSAGVLLRYAELEPGEEMLGFDTSAVEARLKKSLPLLDTVQVQRHLNGTVSIAVTEQTALYYTRHNVNYYILSAETHEVLSVHANPQEARRVGAVYLGLPTSARVRVGEEVSFVNLPYASETSGGELTTYEPETDVPEVEYAYVSAFIETVNSSALAANLTGMELGDRYDLWLVLDRRIRVCLGGMEELDRKLDLVIRLLNEIEEIASAPDGVYTLIDISNPARIVHRTAPDVAMPEWVTGLGE